ncbi:MAG TPA: 30S ribosome-binding factor RbfA [Clostridia bacterium]|jgi:ribosome-binding factor A|nr:30S ribosome-binding factor RbfA [Clostridia bacterium]
MVNHRSFRMGEEIKRELSRLIHEEMKDPRLKGLISITHVDVTNDLGYARIYVSIMAEPADQSMTLQVLQKASGFLRSELAKTLATYQTPELIFKLDASIEYGARINRILEDINQQKGENK